MTTYEVINCESGKSHGEFETLDEARGCVLFDRLFSYMIMFGNECVVDCDQGPISDDPRVRQAMGEPEEPTDEGLAYLDRLDGWHGPHHA